MTHCEFDHIPHNCWEPLACLRAAVQVGDNNAARNDRTELAGFPIIWPDDERWEVAA